MPHLNVTSANFDQEVLSSKIPVLADFWAPWCGPCQMLGPTIEQLSEELKDSVKVVKINIEEAPDLAEKYNIQSIPTVLIIKNGQIKQTLNGLRGKQDYLDALTK